MMMLLLAGFQFVYVDQLTLDQSNSEGPPQQRPIGILQCERIGANNSNVSCAPTLAHYTLDTREFL
jgi:hypothetical protein